MVIRPTPPGTGLMLLHLGATDSKSTSPLMAKPDFLEESGTLLMPTSIIAAPSLIISPVKKPGFPNAATTISAERHNSLMLDVRLWHTVTVALPKGSFLLSRMLIGLPITLLLPITTACLPVVSILKCYSNNMMPSGVAGTKVGSPSASLPALTG
jgi:hypothetical protein